MLQFVINQCSVCYAAVILTLLLSFSQPTQQDHTNIHDQQDVLKSLIESLKDIPNVQGISIKFNRKNDQHTHTVNNTPTHSDEHNHDDHQEKEQKAQPKSVNNRRISQSTRKPVQPTSTTSESYEEEYETTTTPAPPSTPRKQYRKRITTTTTTTTEAPIDETEAIETTEQPKSIVTAQDDNDPLGGTQIEVVLSDPNISSPEQPHETLHETPHEHHKPIASTATSTTTTTTTPAPPTKKQVLPSTFKTPSTNRSLTTTPKPQGAHIVIEYLTRGNQTVGHTHKEVAINPPVSKSTPPENGDHSSIKQQLSTEANHHHHEDEQVLDESVSFDLPESVRRASNASSTPTTYSTTTTTTTTTTERPRTSRKPYSHQENICGLTTKARIVGGLEVDPQDWLWIAGILKVRDSKAGPFCGGAIISASHILTAAHCLATMKPDSVFVRLGSYDFSELADPYSRDYDVENFIIHPKYDRLSHSNENDIGIIKLRTPVTFTDYIKPICLPQRGRLFVNEIGTVIGFGTQSYSIGSSATKLNGQRKLHQTSIPIWDNDKCGKAYKKNMTRNFVCAGLEEGGKDACQGDSGSPLMVEGPENRQMVVGVVSHGHGCGLANYPGVYTRVSSFIDWILEIERESER